MKTRVFLSGLKPFFIMVALFLFICNGLSQNKFNKQLLFNTGDTSGHTEQFIEEPLELATWMTDVSYFDSLINNEENEVEMEASLENWMTDVNYFTEFSKLTNALKISIEKPIELELWMVDSTYFLQLENLLEESAEEEPEVEDWMINKSYWDKNKIDI